VRRRNRLISLGVSVVIAAGALTGAFIAGSHYPAVTVVSGEAHVGDGVATAFVDGWPYGIPMDVAWLGTDGSWRQSGTPACMAWTGTPVTSASSSAGCRSPHPTTTAGVRSSGSPAEIERRA
jgi:hypothetical protein